MTHFRKNKEDKVPMTLWQKIKFGGIIAVAVVILFFMITLPWKCQRSVHYNLSYRGRIADQIDKAVDKHVKEYHAEMK